MNNRIEFGELRIGEVARKHIDEALASNWITMGPKVALLEEKWKNLFGYQYATAVNSGTSADLAACIALYDYGAKPGDEIIIPALSFIATANAVRAAGFTPVFVDVKLETMNIDETQIEAAITPRTVAIMAVNLMGKPCAMDVIADICDRHALKFIVDNCEAYGSTLHGQYALDYADFETSSHFTAHLIMSVEMGIVSSKTAKSDYLIRSIRSHGRHPSSQYFTHDRYGLNLKPTDLHACVGLEQVENFWEVFNKRKENLGKILTGLDVFRCDHAAWFTTEDDNASNCPHGLSITLKPHNKGLYQYLVRDLDASNIAWKRNFGSMPDHGAFEYLGQKGKFPNATYIGNYGLHIGCHYYLTDNDIGRIVNTLRGFFRNV